ncbi:hypothetical protein [Paracoccus sp. JM45]|uniref:hypothetical protein n=1 Tax=Paracoccus sp. JM45 TaxID=2283626 RepID=UPI0016048B57|nr:hypothetical protein [Paracoccus sp. JM45]
MEKHDFDFDKHITVIRPAVDFSHDKRVSYLGQMWRCTGVRHIGGGQLELSLCVPNSDQGHRYEVTALSQTASAA